MWLPQSATAPHIPGYNLLEQRREQGKRGGIAMYIKSALNVVKSRGNEYAQTAQIQLPDSTKFSITNVYMPPTSSL